MVIRVGCVNVLAVLTKSSLGASLDLVKARVVAAFSENGVSGRCRGLQSNDLGEVDERMS
jgi:hypothetical protein